MIEISILEKLYMGPSPEIRRGLVTGMAILTASIGASQEVYKSNAYGQSPAPPVTPEYPVPTPPNQQPDVLKCAGKVVTIAGTKGADRIYGTPRDDVIHAGDGDDVVFAGAGNDYVCGGNGNDTVSGMGGKDKLYGNSGDDELSGSSGNDRLSGGSGEDTHDDGNGNDMVYGGPGDDYSESGSGSDIIRGGAGDDELRGNHRDTLNGNIGVDFCYGVNPKNKISCSTNRGLKLIPGTTNAVGSGKIITYVVKAERGLASVKPKEAAKEIDEILAHPDGWTRSGVVGFKRVSKTSKAKVTFKISSPKKTDSLCRQGGVFGTNSRVSCRTGNSINLNSDRWKEAVGHWPVTSTGKKNVSTYRYYLAQHEMGHFLGFGENNNSVCTRKGGPAPIMQQQTKFFLGCKPNFFPLASEIDTLKGRYRVNR
jgi:Ca2+-binding RTX toxin-like protein